MRPALENKMLKLLRFFLFELLYTLIELTEAIPQKFRLLLQVFRFLLGGYC